MVAPIGNVVLKNAADVHVIVDNVVGVSFVLVGVDAYGQLCVVVESVVGMFTAVVVTVVKVFVICLADCVGAGVCFVAVVVDDRVIGVA